MPAHAAPRSPADCSDLAYVGRLSQDKGLLRAVAGLAAISERHPTSRLLDRRRRPADADLRQGRRRVGALPRAGWTVAGRLPVARLGARRRRPVPAPAAPRGDAARGRRCRGPRRGRSSAATTPESPTWQRFCPGCVTTPAGQVRALRRRHSSGARPTRKRRRGWGVPNADASRVGMRPSCSRTAWKRSTERAIDGRRPARQATVKPPTHARTSSSWRPASAHRQAGGAGARQLAAQRLPRPRPRRARRPPASSSPRPPVLSRRTGMSLTSAGCPARPRLQRGKAETLVQRGIQQGRRARQQRRRARCRRRGRRARSTGRPGRRTAAKVSCPSPTSTS